MKAHPASPHASLERLRARVRRVLPDRLMGTHTEQRGWDIDVAARCGAFGLQVELLDSALPSPARSLWYPYLAPVTDDLIRTSFDAAYRVCRDWEETGKLPGGY